MAKTHNSKIVEARQKARELATAQQERHEKLLTLAESFFVTSDEADSAVAAAKETAAKLIKTAEAQSETKRLQAQKLIVSMVETGASVADVASRLGLTAAAVRSAVKATTSPKAEHDKDSTEDASEEQHERQNATV